MFDQNWLIKNQSQPLGLEVELRWNEEIEGKSLISSTSMCAF